MDSTRAFPSNRARYTFRKLLHNRASLPTNNFRDRDAPQNMEHQTKHDNRKRENVKPQLPAHLTCNSLAVYSRVHRAINLAQFVYASLLTSATSMPWFSGFQLPSNFDLMISCTLSLCCTISRPLTRSFSSALLRASSSFLAMPASM